MRFVDRDSDSAIGRAMRVLVASALVAVFALPASGVAATPPDVNDPTNPPDLTGTSVSGTFSVVDNVDYYRFMAIPGQYLTLDASADPANYDSLDMVLYSGLSNDVFDEVTGSRTTSAEEYISWLVPPGSGGSCTVEMKRVYPPIGNVDWDLEWSLDSTMTPRLWGKDRYETSYAISRSTFTTATHAVIASGADFPDALAASGLAGVFDCPVLLTKPNSAPAGLQRELIRLGVTKVYVIGGISAVTESVFDLLETWGSISVAERIDGSNRYDTARLVAEEIWRETGSPVDMDNAFVVRGDDFADALAISPFAYHEAIPVLLTKPGTLSGHTYNFIDTYKVQDVIVAGGEGAVSADVYDDLAEVVQDDVFRWWGSNRYATAADCAEKGVARGWADWTNVGIATGQSFPDALSGGVSCGQYGGPLLLTKSTSLSTACHDAIQTNGGLVWMELIFGGEAALAESVVREAGSLPF